MPQIINKYSEFFYFINHKFSFFTYGQQTIFSAVTLKNSSLK